MSDREEYTILGRIAGTATGWDQGDTFAIILYNFEPHENCKIPKSESIFLNFDTGVWTTEEGVEGDVLEAFINAEKKSDNG